MKHLEKFFQIFELPNEIDRAFFNKIVLIENNDIAKIITMVNSNRDREYYQDPKPVDDSKTELYYSLYYSLS